MLARGPVMQTFPNYELKKLVDEKVNQQDITLRERLRSLKYDIDASDTVRLLCGGNSVENVRAFS
jgi:hypothetical protein